MFNFNFGCPHVASWLDGEDLASIPDVTATQAKKITIEFAYPLAKPIRFDFESETGFTLAAIVTAVCKTYRIIYDEEKNTTKVEEGRAGQLLNRNTTDGKYGIWGHDIGDLFIEGIEEGPNDVWKLHMGS